MQDTIAKKDVLKGGEFLIKSAKIEDTFIPEEFDDEQLMIRDMVKDFLHQEILPNADKIEHQEDNISVKLLS